MPEVLADLSGAVGDKVAMELFDYDLVRRIWNRDLGDLHRVSEEAVANSVPKSWRDRAFIVGKQAISCGSVEVLPAHDVGTISFSKEQHRRGKLVNKSRSL